MSRLSFSVTVIGLILSLALSVSGKAWSAGPERASPSLEQILVAWTHEKAGSDAAAITLLRYAEKRLPRRIRASGSREAKTVRRLAETAPGTYVPVIGLYNRAHLLAVRNGRTGASDYLRLETTRLIGEYMSRARSPEARRIASKFFVSLAAALRDTREIETSLDLLDEALDADSHNPQALFAAGAIREKFGQYSTAADLFARLVEESAIPEAALRLALCLARSGKAEVAEVSLRPLTAPSSPSWVRAVAYQEWSRLRMSQGDPGGALRIALDGHEALPEDESLAVLVAFMSGPRDPRSRSLGARLTSQPTGSGLTARGLYNLWPAGIEMARNEETLSQAIRARMLLLVVALQSLEVPPDGGYTGTR